MNKERKLELFFNDLDIKFNKLIHIIGGEEFTDHYIDPLDVQDMMSELLRVFPMRYIEISSSGVIVNDSGRGFTSKATWGMLFSALRESLIEDFIHSDNYTQYTLLFDGTVQFFKGEPNAIFRVKTTQIYLPDTTLLEDWILNFKSQKLSQIEIFYEIRDFKILFPNLIIKFYGFEGAIKEDIIFINGRKYTFWEIKDWHKEEPVSLISRSGIYIEDIKEFESLVKQMLLLRGVIGV